MSEIKNEQPETEKNRTSRRDFLKLAGALAVTAGVAQVAMNQMTVNASSGGEEGTGPPSICVSDANTVHSHAKRSTTSLMICVIALSPPRPHKLEKNSSSHVPVCIVRKPHACMFARLRQHTNAQMGLSRWIIRVVSAAVTVRLPALTKRASLTGRNRLSEVRNRRTLVYRKSPIVHEAWWKNVHSARIALTRAWSAVLFLVLTRKRLRPVL